MHHAYITSCILNVKRCHSYRWVFTETIIVVEMVVVEILGAIISLLKLRCIF